MSVFISWGEKESLSHAGALLLQKWLPEVLQGLACFVSSEDTASGALWLTKLFEHLDKSESGILCVTKETLNRNWMLFEAGALAKQVGQDTARVCPLLFELPISDLKFPLAAFQSHSLDKNEEDKSKKEVFQLIKTLNQNSPAEQRRAEDRLEKQFNRCWSEFWNPYLEICKKHTHHKTSHAVSKISNEDVLAEMRGAIRQIADALTELRRGQRELPAVPTRLPTASQTPLTSALPTSLETLKCPVCFELVSVEMPEYIGATRVVRCNNCNSSVYIHRNAGRVFARVSKPTADGPAGNWQHFLMDTQSWVDSSVLTGLVAATVKALTESKSDGELTPDSLCKRIFAHVDSEPSLGFSRTTARSFVKLVFFGGAFQFGVESKDVSWKTPFTNKPDQKTIIQAYARCVVRRLRTKFALTFAELPVLQKLLFPPEFIGAEAVLQLVLTEAE